MKKLVVAILTTGVISIGASPASATVPPVSVPVECAESDNRPDNCAIFYPPGVVSPDEPDPTTTLAPPVATLPDTGSTVSPILQFGSLMLIGGILVVVATRRRSDASAPAT